MIRIFVGLLLGMGGVGLVESSVGYPDMLLGAFISLAGGLIILSVNKFNLKSA